MEKEIINDPKSKPALKPILSSFGVGRASQRKKQEEKLKMKNPENNGFWNYWSSNFGSLKSLVSNKDNPNRILPSETIISEVLDTRKCLFCKVIGENNDAGRLLFYETKTWMHVNCIIWNSTVQELKVSPNPHKTQLTYHIISDWRSSQCKKSYFQSHGNQMYVL